MLAYNNLAYQTALITAPLAAGAVYMANREWVFYSAAILDVCGGLAMAWMGTWRSMKGKTMKVKPAEREAANV